MLVHQAFRYELAPTPAQRAALTNHAGAARWAWNWGLAVRRKAWRRRRHDALDNRWTMLQDVQNLIQVMVHGFTP